MERAGAASLAQAVSDEDLTHEANMRSLWLRKRGPDRTEPRARRRREQALAIPFHARGKTYLVQEK